MIEQNIIEILDLYPRHIEIAEVADDALWVKINGERRLFFLPKIIVDTIKEAIFNHQKESQVFYTHIFKNMSKQAQAWVEQKLLEVVYNEAE